jgi:hypothetical protein
MSRSFFFLSKPFTWFFFILLLLLFAFRLVYGLTSEFWFEDEMQIYLIGLKFYCSGHWPFFGPDIVYTASQIPGALQGLLTGIPFYILPVAESPAILLNIITFLSLCFLAWYIRKILPSIPWWFVWIWVLTCPWTLNYSTHVVNPSYALVGGIFFFIAFLEAVPSLAGKLISRTTSFFLMGFSFFWVMQLHMSWVLMVPYILYVFFLSVKIHKSPAKDLLFFCLGAAIPLAIIIPTYVQYGMAAGSGDASANIRINWKNAEQIITVISRYLSFASYELPRFLGSNTPARLALVKQYWPFIPFFVYVLLIGLLQPVILFVYLFLPSKVPFQMRVLTGITMLIIWISFFFSVKGPSSHTFYITFPLAMIYSVFVWNELFPRTWFRRIMVGMLVSGIIVSGVLIHEHYSSRSLYKNRELPQKAIAEKNYHFLGERRNFDRNE